jgi:hypothetical protein
MSMLRILIDDRFSMEVFPRVFPIGKTPWFTGNPYDFDKTMGKPMENPW